MNELLQRLESQKAKLPPEDRSIIDWGISFVQAKIREEEQLMNSIWKKFDESADFFNKNLNEGNSGLTKDELENKVFELGYKHLEEIVEHTFFVRDDTRTEKNTIKYVQLYRRNLKKFCDKEGRVDSFKKIIQQQQQKLTLKANNYDKMAENPDNKQVKYNIQIYAETLRKMIKLLNDNT